MTYNAIRYAEDHGVDDRRGMKGFYQSLKDAEHARVIDATL